MTPLGKQPFLATSANIVGKISGTRYRVPDFTVLDRELPIEQIITVPPIAVFEILSPEDTMTRILVKLGDYEQMGIANVFV